MKRILPVLAGVLTGMLVIFVIETLGHMVYPIEMNLETATPEAKADFLKHIPPAAIAIVIIAWALGAMGAGIVSTLISKDNSSEFYPALKSGGILLGFGIINMIMIPHPIWFWIAGILVYLPFAWLGYKIAVRKNHI